VLSKRVVLSKREELSKRVVLSKSEVLSIRVCCLYVCAVYTCVLSKRVVLSICVVLDDSQGPTLARWTISYRTMTVVRHMCTTTSHSRTLLLLSFMHCTHPCTLRKHARTAVCLFPNSHKIEVSLRFFQARVLGIVCGSSCL